MFNIRQYWQQVRAMEATIADKEPFLMSLEDSSRGMVGGLVVQVQRESAAKLILGKSHRLAMPDEIERHEQANQTRRAAMRVELLRKAGHTTYTLPPGSGGTIVARRSGSAHTRQLLRSGVNRATDITRD